MLKLINKTNILLIILYLLFTTPLRAEIVKEINVEGNQRVSSETIKMFTGVSINDDLSENDLNQTFKKLYNTNFFDSVFVKIINNSLQIRVKEIQLFKI